MNKLLKSLISTLIAATLLLALACNFTLPAFARGDAYASGVQVINLTPEMAIENNGDPNSPFLLPEISGLLIVYVVPGTPAAEAGLRKGDVILEVEDQSVTAVEQWEKILKETNVDQGIKLLVKRGDRTREYSF
jgi:S1-C subfamily serine protease